MITLSMMLTRFLCRLDPSLRADDRAGDLRLLVRALGASLLLHLLAAVFNYGHQNVDEHFQILEFANWFLGGVAQVADLPIEFHRMIRPWFEPLYCALPIALLRSLGLTNPFTQTLWIRLVFSLLGWGMTLLLSLGAFRIFQDGATRRRAVWFLSLIWFAPALHGRYSSENFAGILWFSAVALLILEVRGKEGPLSWGAGVLMGLAFHARYQMGILILGYALWSVFFERLSGETRAWLQAKGRILGGLVLALAFGLVLDRVGYGVWRLTPWNYFHFNLVEGQVYTGGVDPWWDYFRRSWTESVPVLGFLTLALSLVAWLRFPRHLLTWTSAPLLLLHMVIGHKETRFLFPMASVTPLLFGLALSPGRRFSWESLFASRKASGAIFRVLTRGVIFLNLAVLLILVFVPTWYPQRYYSWIYQEFEGGRIAKLHYVGTNAYWQGNLKLNFYQPPGLALEPYQPGIPRPFFVSVQRPSEVPPELQNAPGCQEVFSLYSGTILDLMKTLRLNQISNPTIYLCR